MRWGEGPGNMSDTTGKSPHTQLQELISDIRAADEQLPEPWNLEQSASEIQRTAEALERIGR